MRQARPAGATRNESDGAPGGTRTPDPPLRSRQLCPLSYWSIVATPAGLEPATSRVGAECSRPSELRGRAWRSRCGSNARPSASEADALSTELREQEVAHPEGLEPPASRFVAGRSGPTELRVHDGGAVGGSRTRGLRFTKAVRCQLRHDGMGGGPGRDRTGDLSDASGALSHLSYRPMKWCPTSVTIRVPPPCRGGALPVS